jgi:hypothetical protein
MTFKENPSTPMSSTLDLNLLPIQRLDGKDSQAFPGLFMATPPRRAARSRINDLLVIYFSVSGNAPLAVEQEQQLLGRLAQLYYKTSGSISAAMKAVADSLNIYLLERNLRSTSAGQQTIGFLTVAVLKNEKLMLAQCGPIRAFLIQSKGVQELYDPQLAGRGLGLTRSASIRYFQADLQAHDLLVVSPQPPSGWTDKTLHTVHGQALESLRRKLLSQAGPDVEALIMCALPGVGKIRLMRPRPPVQMVQPIDTSSAGKTELPEPKMDNLSRPSEATQAAKPISDPIPPVIDQVVAPPEKLAGAVVFSKPSPKDDEERTNIEGSTAVDKSQLKDGMEDDLDFLLPFEDVPANSRVERLLTDLPEAGGESGLASTSVPPQEIVPSEIQRKEDDKAVPKLPPQENNLPSIQAAETEHQKSQAISKAAVKRISFSNLNQAPTFGWGKYKKIFGVVVWPFRKIWEASRRLVSAVIKKLLRVFASLLKLILPDESMFTIPGSTMAFTAIAVAVVIAVAGALVYFQRGYQAQYYVYFEQALMASQQAEQESDPIELRSSWDTVLFFLDKAETYKRTGDSAALRTQAQKTLDSFDYIYRLSYQEAIVGKLGGSVQITQLVATSSELYMYNATNGVVMRATLTGNGYEIDPDFKCATNPTFGPVVGLIPGVRTDIIKAAVIALDPKGNLLYCNPGDTPKMISPAPPQTNWGLPAGLSIDNGSLYMLDPLANAVWIFKGMDVTNPPHLFFDEQIPPMQNTVDLEINRDDLYLLHDDGMITTCKFRSFQVSKTRCESPAVISDPRPGRHDGPRVLDAQFQQMQFTPAPDPSIYLLDPLNQSVYHFSLRLNLQRQFRPQKSLAGDTATAFTVSPNRTLFLASGNQVYFAILP